MKPPTRRLVARPAIVALLVAASLATAPVSFAQARRQAGLARFDRNGDGRLQREEAPPALARRFDELDTDGSGALDRVELTRWLMSRAGDESREVSAPELPRGDPSWGLVGATIERMIADRGLEGAVYRVVQGDHVIYEQAFGSFDAAKVLNVASATKWVTAAVVLALVDDGLLDLDAPLSRYLPDVGPELGAMTLAQMLSHTSGLPGLSTNPIDLQLPVDISMSEAARRILALGLERPPGTAFDYGGASLQVAGAVAEKVTGKPWETLFEERIARPVGMGHSFYGHPRAALEGRRKMTNPNLQAGLHTSLDDYSKFQRMVVHHGEIDGRRVLSASLIARQERTRLTGLEKLYLPGGAKPEYEYGLGVWCEVIAEDGTCPVVSSPGAWGTYPWIDRPRDLVGLLVVKDRLPNLVPYIDRIRELTNVLVDEQP